MVGIRAQQEVRKLQKDDLLSLPYQDAQRISIGIYKGSPLEHIKRLVEPLSDDDHEQHSLFVEHLHIDEPDTTEWHEKARWIKFEETAEEDGHRWSKPHISLLTLPGLLQARNCFTQGAVLLDYDGDSFEDVAYEVVDQWLNMDMIAKEDSRVILRILLGKKKHLIIHHIKEEFGLAITKSFHHLEGLHSVGSKAKISSGDLTKLHKTPSRTELDHHPVHNHQNGKESTVKFAIEAYPSEKDLHHVDSTSHSSAGALTRKPSKPQLAMFHMLKKLHGDCEGAVIMTGSSSRIKKTAAAFVRIQTGCDFEHMLEVPVPLRFFAIILVPDVDIGFKNPISVQHIGQHFGALFSDEVFACVAYRAQEASDLAWAVDEFLSHIVIIPPGKWDHSVMLEPSEQPVKQPDRTLSSGNRPVINEMVNNDEEEYKISEGLIRTGRCFGGLIADIQRKLPLYKSDIMDALDVRGLGQCIATSVFLFFALLTNIVTFGAVMGKALHHEMSVLEAVVSGFLCGVIFALFSGQPMNILSATGPVLVFEKILFKICHAGNWSFMAGRFWVGMWTAGIMILIVATDMSALVALVTRYTEECFATLIAVLFIVQAFEEIVHLSRHYPLTKDPVALLKDPCRCIMGNATYYINETFDFPHDQFPSDYCEETLGGKPEGLQCEFHPDIFLMSFLLFFGTFLMIIFLKGMKTSSFFPTKVRVLISDFSSFLSIIIMTGISHFVGLNMPTLHIPTELKPTSGRSWIVSPFSNIPFFLPFLALVPAILFSILVFMDQQITAVIVNRPDNKLKKGFGYHLDLFVLAILIITCSILGIPFFVAATVLSINHVQSLRVESETAAPGEKPQFLGIREQRITALMSAVLIGLSLLMAQWIRLIPTPVLYGVFLFMGYSSLNGQQLIDRISLAFIPPKYQPDYNYLRVVPLLRVHFFTLTQIVSLVVLYVVKHSKKTSMLFPLMLIVIVGVRKLLDKVFLKRELDALDHPVPTWVQLNAGRETTCCPSVCCRKQNINVSDIENNGLPNEQKFSADDGTKF